MCAWCKVALADDVMMLRSRKRGRWWRMLRLGRLWKRLMMMMMLVLLLLRMLVLLRMLMM